MPVFKIDLAMLDGDQPLRAESLESLAVLAEYELQQRSGLVTVPAAIRLQSALVAARQFETTLRLALALEEAGVTVTTLGKFHVQALIDSGQLNNATERIERLLQEVRSGEPEYVEICGLAGRVAKQRYVNAALVADARPEAMIEAIDRYLLIYDSDARRPIWHGINAVALLLRAQRDGVAHPASTRALQIAKDILSRVRQSWQTDTMDFWSLATASEAALALGDHDGAELWLHRYVDHPDRPAFALASTLRQFREVWQLGPRSSPGTLLLPILERRLAGAGQMQMSANEVIEGEFGGEFEKVFGKESFISHARYITGTTRARSIARVEDRFGDPQGTGFLVGGAEISERFRCHPYVFLTNAHVVSMDDPRAVHPDNAVCSFYGAASDAEDSVVKANIREVLWSSPDGRFDTTILLLDREIPGAEGCPLARHVPDPGPDGRVWIIGHPGGALSFSLTDNRLLAIEKNGARIHYRTPTSNGSSGSPVFDQNWDLVAIHHKGSSVMPRLDGVGYYEANQGIQLRAIRQALA